MKKRITIIVFALFLCFALSVTAFADGARYVYDDTGCLADEEISALDQAADAIYQAFGIGVYYAKVSDNQGMDTSEYAELFYNEVATGSDGMILLISDEASEWCIYRTGRAADALTVSDEDALWEAFDVEETWYGGVSAYLTKAATIFSAYGLVTNDAPVASDDPSSATEPDAAPSLISGNHSRLVDNADLLTDSEESALLAQLDEISQRQNCDVIIVTVDSLGGQSATAFADDFYDQNDYGMGSGDDGILLLLSMGERNWAISTYGYGTYAFTDAGQEYMTDRFLPALSNGDYATGFGQYATLCDEFLTQARAGSPYDRGNLPKSPLSLIWIPIALVIGIVVALIVTGVMKGKLKSVRRQAAASNYFKRDSMRITDSRDMFLYTHVDKRARPQNTSGSSTHISSSGRFHGGSSGRF